VLLSEIERERRPAPLTVLVGALESGRSHFATGYLSERALFIHEIAFA
jgi:hypothetical protein